MNFLRRFVYPFRKKLARVEDVMKLIIRGARDLFLAISAKNHERPYVRALFDILLFIGV